jgi:hypothetical protein
MKQPSHEMDRPRGSLLIPQKLRAFLVALMFLSMANLSNGLMASISQQLVVYPTVELDVKEEGEQ